MAVQVNLSVLTLFSPDLGPRCYECATNETFECPVHQCIFNDGQCYSAWKQNASSVSGRRFEYGCTKPDLCNKTKEASFFVEFCNGSLCNEG